MVKAVSLAMLGTPTAATASVALVAAILLVGTQLAETPRTPIPRL
jgi:hypothetical protein